MEKRLCPIGGYEQYSNYSDKLEIAGGTIFVYLCKRLLFVYDVIWYMLL